MCALQILMVLNTAVLDESSSKMFVHMCTSDVIGIW